MTVIQRKIPTLEPVPSRDQDRIVAIDGLRALAVLAIILFHLDERLLPGGFAGVDIFFVLSGFVVAKSASAHRLARPQDGFAAQAGEFFRRRILRIYPALLTVVLTSALLAGLFLPLVPDTRYMVPTGIAALVGAGNIFLYSIAGDYFADVLKFNPFTHTWSLGAEEQFYLLFPFFAWFLFTGIGARRLLAEAALLAAIAASLVWVVLAGHGPGPFFLIFTRFWEPALGLLLFVHAPAITQLLASRAGWRRAAGILGFGLIAGALLFADPARFPFPDVFAPAFGTALLIAALLPDETNSLNRLFAAAPAQWIGARSYSLYLWHWVVIVALRWVWHEETWAGAVLALALTVALSALTYALIETPLRTAARLRALPRWQFFTGFAVALGLSLGVAGLPLVLKGRMNLSATRDQVTWSTTAIPPAAAGDCKVAVTNGTLPGGRKIGFTPEECTGSRQGGKLFIAGDSHAGAYWRSAYNLAARANVSTTLMTKGGCPLLIFAPASIGTGCEAFRTAVMDELAATAEPGDTLFLTALYLPRFRTAFDLTAPPDQAKAPPTPPEEVRALLDLLARKQVKLVLEAPKPLLKTAAFRCADAWTKTSTYCSTAPAPYARNELITARTGILSAMQALAATRPDITIWDPFDLLCPDETCTSQKDGKPLFYDTDHLTGFGNDLLSPHLARDMLGRDFGRM